MKKPRVLIVDDDESTRGQIRWALCRECEVVEARERTRALEAVKALRPRAVVVDLGLPPKPREPEEGLKTVSGIFELDPLAKVLVVTGLQERKAAMRAVGLGVFDYLTKPVSLEELRSAVRRALRIRDIQEENARAEAAPGIEGIIGGSSPMLELYRVIRKVAAADVPVLLLGESGTGKEAAANAIHGLSPRSEGPLSIINCGAIPEDLLESELFGYEKGAFTGADERKKGRIEYAEGGTLFLDEIGELSLRLQVKLLRFLQEHTIERVGSRAPVKVNARVVSATNRNIRALVRAGAFREDLYYRLAVVSVTMPPLREREGDIYQLALWFLMKYSRRLNAGAGGFDKKAVASLASHRWPGNVRELENRIRRAVALGRGPAITAADLELDEGGQEAAAETTGLLEAKETFKKQIICEALLRNRGMVGKTANELGISRQYLSRLISRYGIKSG